MNIRIKASSITLTPAITDYINKRLNKILQLIGNDPSVLCDVDVGKAPGHSVKGEVFRAEVHIVGAGKNLFASSEKSDLYAAVDDVRDEIMRELKSTKDKSLSLMRRGGARMKGMIKGLWPWKE